MNVRNAILSDLPEIIAIYNSTIKSGVVTADVTPISTESRLAWFHDHNPHERPLWVAIDSNNEIVGWLSFNDFYGRPAYNITAEISLYIHEQHRGKGYGSALLGKAIATAPSLGLENLLGFIFSSNTSSVNLFKKNGFEPWGELRQVAIINQSHTDLIILGKSIKQ